MAGNSKIVNEFIFFFPTYLYIIIKLIILKILMYNIDMGMFMKLCM